MKKIRQGIKKVFSKDSSSKGGKMVGRRRKQNPKINKSARKNHRGNLRAHSN